MGTGRLKLEFVRRLGPDWMQLADLLGIRPHEKERFLRSEEPRSIWEWLENRDRLNELAGNLRVIGRDDLADMIGDAFEATDAEHPVSLSVGRSTSGEHVVVCGDVEGGVRLNPGRPWVTGRGRRSGGWPAWTCVWRSVPGVAAVTWYAPARRRVTSRSGS